MPIGVLAIRITAKATDETIRGVCRGILLARDHDTVEQLQNRSHRRLLNASSQHALILDIRPATGVLLRDLP
jgi:hypothetical protein